jgi:hypothetical protein
MGEYALYNGERIKIGTCENMYYLRADQVHKVQPLDGNVNPHSIEQAGQIRFPFPFPQEDNEKPGEFDDHDYGLGLYGVEPPAEIDHYSIQFQNSKGLLVSLPCPESRGSKAFPFKIHYNGYSGKVKISQQRLIDGKLVLVCECGSCGAKYRLPTIQEAQPIIDQLLKDAADDRRRSNESRAKYHEEVAARIVNGYTQPNYWSATVPA